jgi:hypothetical protein
VGELLSGAWEAYRARFGALLGLYLLSVVMGLAPLAAGAAIAAAVQSGVGLAAGALVAAVGATWMGGWGVAAFVHAVADDRLGFGAALSAGRARAWSFAWLVFLLGFVLTGGTLLLVVPGIVFSVWLAFAPFAAVAEDARGMGALLRSRALVRGSGFAVFVRLLVVAIVGAVLGAIPFLGPILSLLYAPFAAVYGFLLYEELRGMRPDAGVPSRGAEIGRLLGGALAGYVAVPLLVLALAGGSILQLLALAQAGAAAARGDETAAAALAAMVAPADLGPAAPAPAAERADAAPPAGAPYEFDRNRGVWIGTPQQGGAPVTFTFSGASEFRARAADGTFVRGKATTLWHHGVEGESLRVLPGGALFDVVVLEASDPALSGKLMLGSWKRELEELQLCLGEPGGTRRTSAFETRDGISCFALRRDAAAAPGGATAEGTPAPPPEPQAPLAPSRDDAADPTKDLSVFVYAVNYTGTIRVNGEAVRELEGERDMQYNYTFSTDAFRPGRNVIEVAYRRLDDPGSLHRIEVRVSRWGDGPRQVLGEWRVDDAQGTRAFELEL